MEIELLQSIGIDVPELATSYHTEGEEIVFMVALPHESGHYQGDWDTIKVKMTDQQKAKMEAVSRIGSGRGWDLRHAITAQENWNRQNGVRPVRAKTVQSA